MTQARTTLLLPVPQTKITTTKAATTLLPRTTALLNKDMVTHHLPRDSQCTIPRKDIRHSNKGTTPMTEEVRQAVEFARVSWRLSHAVAAWIFCSKQ